MVDVYKIAFASLRGIGVEIAQHILDIIGTEELFFTLPQKELENITRIKNKIIDSTYRRAVLEKAKIELEFIEKNKISTCYFSDSTNFPHRLIDVPDAPIMLYGKGNCDLNSTHIISIVGTRHATQYGKSSTEKIVSEVAECLPSAIIVSGLAYGIDVCAHKSALTHSLSTIGVLAHGLNTIYPSQHRNIAIEMIENNGMLLTDYMSQDAIHKGNFLARNRIVAALSDCTIVIESAEKGGALVTAAIANSYNRDVFALPGRSNDIYSSGCNSLIRRNKASLITSGYDIVESMNWTIVKKEGNRTIFPEYSEEEQKVIDFITDKGDSHINDIAYTLNIPVHKAMSLMVDMEFEGYVKAIPGGKYTLA